VGGFDAELYLRTTGEEVILGLRPRPHGPWDSPLLEHADALLAIGAISRARARAVIDDYALAEAVRSDERQQLRYQMVMAHRPRARRRRGASLKPRRVVACNRTIEDSSGVLLVRHVTLSEDTTSLAITWRPRLSGRGRSTARGHMMMFGHGPGGPLHPQLTDDRGTTAGTLFGGGGSDSEWVGHLTADRPLAPDTAWIEVDGTRLELTGEVVPCAVTIEPLAEEAPAHRYLWRRLAWADFRGPPEIEGSIEALIAAGALPSDDPVLAQIRAAQSAMPHHPGMRSGGHSGTRSLPEPWRSLFGRQGREDGPEGTLAVSAVTPEFDGFGVAVSCLDSRADGFGLEVEVTPGFVGHGAFREEPGSSRLAWWAADERGNHHLGQIGSWSGGDGYGTGELNFWPPLRPKARQLLIMPTGETSRAVITVPLTWDRAQTSGEAEPA
jgi:hypothetical protein